MRRQSVVSNDCELVQRDSIVQRDKSHVVELLT